MAQWEAMFSQLSAEEKAEWNSMSPQERTEMRHELEAEQAEEDRIAEEARRASEGERNRLARQTDHTNLIDTIKGGQTNVIEESYGPDSKYAEDPEAIASGLIADKPQGLMNTAIHPTQLALLKNAEKQAQAPAGGAGTKVG